ncbi:unnamed protein product [Sphenostylis stenocarpa]|uniref:Uncharacterized protein n=1 Tax=Sphenostylis stenocarpa TaxID=92480 RepID=A0AA86S5A1_9FABA|nr:unnamed protein product [Sphenostylis stenocarpa]
MFWEKHVIIDMLPIYITIYIGRGVKEKLGKRPSTILTLWAAVSLALMMLIKWGWASAKMKHETTMEPQSLWDREQTAGTSVTPSITKEGPRISMVTTLIAIETNRTYYQWGADVVLLFWLQLFQAMLKCGEIDGGVTKDDFYMLLFFSEEK